MEKLRAKELGMFQGADLSLLATVAEEVSRGLVEDRGIRATILVAPLSAVA